MTEDRNLCPLLVRHSPKTVVCSSAVQVKSVNMQYCTIVDLDLGVGWWEGGGSGVCVLDE